MTMKSSGSTSMPTEDLSFICIVDFTDKANWQYLSPSVSDVLGYTPEELVGKSSIALVHPDEQNPFISLHYNTITADKAAALVYIRMKHKVVSKGWRLFIITRTIVHNVVVGSVSLARTPQANQVASTAQEVTTLSPAAADLQFRVCCCSVVEFRCLYHAQRWTDPMPSAGNDDLLEAVPRTSPTPTYVRPPSQSFRTAFILDRFTHKCTIKYCSNDLIDIDKEDCIGRPFYEYVAQEDETRFKGYIEQVKGWGVNPLGQPCSGGFGYGSFKLLSKAREYKEPAPVDGGKAKAHKRGTRRSRSSSAAGTSLGLASSTAANGGIIMARPARMAAALKAAPPSATPEDEYTRVDAILSAHSDGVLLILRRVKPDSAPFNA
ncbi:hypothetical protein CYLTODRAFT_418346 [Cylindrobasidium torrendii FP15055 ss-10]|uniref:PAS domain-containing protein n=1 Tax=Cylindrobasidium torrendii FP15055 ss-10 TaxID=1314674 RepID=A0A0D7BNC2_9AGAR|nr:hypothetical protein CYLTODRAFT_418346 [Cylindrobasidium torrendii FP15055 ss-10]